MNYAIIVDPNAQMRETLFLPGARRRVDQPEIYVEVVSRALITPEELNSIGGLVRQVFPAASEVLRSCQLKKELFPYTPR